MTTMLYSRIAIKVYACMADMVALGAWVNPKMGSEENIMDLWLELDIGYAVTWLNRSLGQYYILGEKQTQPNLPHQNLP